MIGNLVKIDDKSGRYLFEKAIRDYFAVYMKNKYDQNNLDLLKGYEDPCDYYSEYWENECEGVGELTVDNLAILLKFIEREIKNMDKISTAIGSVAQNNRIHLQEFYVLIFITWFDGQSRQTVK